MHRHWQHDVSQSWLRLRKAYLCASEVGRLVKDATRIIDGKLKLRDSAAFRDVVADKLSSDCDERSYGAAARGHIMEPEAVAWWNSTVSSDLGTMYHWDDCLACRNVVAFSPDATDVPQPVGDILVSDTEAIGSVLEIKSYSASQHLKRVSQYEADPMSLPELWQLATAMYVCPNVQMARLLLWAPQLNDVHLYSYGRPYLADRIDMVEKVAKLFGEAIRYYGGFIDEGMMTKRSEGEIYNDYLKTIV